MPLVRTRASGAAPASPCCSAPPAAPTGTIRFSARAPGGPKHVNDANLAATVVDQHDLVQGAGDEASPGGCRRRRCTGC